MSKSEIQGILCFMEGLRISQVDIQGICGFVFFRLTKGGKNCISPKFNNKLLKIWTSKRQL